MGYELEKFAEEIQQIVKQKKLYTQDIGADNNSSAPLSDAEVADLNEGLSGEVITSGFTEIDAENLRAKLSVAPKENTDSLYIKTGKDTKPELKNNYPNEGLLELTTESIQKYSLMYPNLARAYVKSGMVFLIDSEGNVIRDVNGEPVVLNSQINPKFDLISFYLRHSNGLVDINKLLQFEGMQKQITGMSEKDEGFDRIKSEIMYQKFKLMGDDEQTNYVITMLCNAFNNNKNEWLNILNEFCNFKSRMIDEEYGISSREKFLENITHPEDLIAYINKVTNDGSNRLLRTDLLGEIITGISKAIRAYKLIAANLPNKITAEILSQIDFSFVSAGAVKAYFGENASVLNVLNLKENTETEDKYDNKADLKLFISGFDGISVKKFRLKIAEAQSIDELNLIKEIIDKSMYKSSDKQILYDECFKQQVRLQSKSDEELEFLSKSEVYDNRDGKVSEDFKQKLRSQISYKIFKYCKNTQQREMAKLLLNDERLYFINTENSEDIFRWIVENCKTKDDFEAKKTFLNSALQQKNLIDKNGVLNKYVFCCVNKVNAQTVGFLLEALNEYINNLSFINADVFGYILNCIDSQDDLGNLAKLKGVELSELENTNSNDGSIRNLFARVNSQNIYGKTFNDIVSEVLNNDADSQSINNFDSETSEREKNKLLNDDEYLSEYSYCITNFVKNGFKTSKPKILQEIVINDVLEDNEKVFVDFTTGRNYTTRDLEELFKYTQKDSSKDVLTELCKRSEFSASDILSVMDGTTEKSNKFTKRILGLTNVTAKEKVDIIKSLHRIDYKYSDLIEELINNGEFDSKLISKVLETAQLLDKNNARWKNGKINPKKVNLYLNLLNNPDTRKFTLELLNKGWDIDAIANLSKEELSSGTIKGNLQNISNEKVDFFKQLGFSETEAIALINIIYKKDSINNDMWNYAVKLADSGIPKHQIIKILRYDLNPIVDKMPNAKKRKDI